MQNYRNLLLNLLHNGEVILNDRSGVGTKRILDAQLKFNLSDNQIPVITCRRIDLESTVNELLWFISGSTNVNDLPEVTQKWWNRWADRNTGTLGSIYGYQLRRKLYLAYLDNEYYIEFDQLQNVIDSIKANPFGRRHIISLWDTKEMQQNCALPCCHGSMIQFFVSQAGELTCKMYQRSADTVVGLPVNIASYAILTHLIAHVTGTTAKELIWIGGDTHLYLNHEEIARQLIENAPIYNPTSILLASFDNINQVTANHIKLFGYLPNETKYNLPLNG
jgi:thymidylate synthase